MNPSPSSPPLPDIPPAEPETIEAAAILRIADNRVFTLPRPARHNHIIDHIIKTEPGVKRVGYGYKQGFLTSTSRFVDRTEACLIARAAGQIKTKHGASNQLYSEDVW